MGWRGRYGKQCTVKKRIGREKEGEIIHTVKSKIWEVKEEEG